MITGLAYVFIFLCGYVIGSYITYTIISRYRGKRNGRNGRKTEDTLETICAVVLNDKNQILPYTCQSTIQACEEWCEENIAGWERMKELGAKVVQSKIILL